MLKNILQFLHNLFKLRQTQTQTCGTTVAGDTVIQTKSEFIDSGISYSDTLIPHLKHDHTELVELYGAIDGFIQQQQYEYIAPGLEELKSKFNLHIMQENLHFYCYLEQSFQDQHDQLEMVKGYRKEMNAISAAVVRFIKKWQGQVIDSTNIADFSQEYNAVGDVLAQRIDQEENHLYTLYQP
jgi:regulator of sigma D